MNVNCWLGFWNVFLCALYTSSQKTFMHTYRRKPTCCTMYKIFNLFPFMLCCLYFSSNNWKIFTENLPLLGICWSVKGIIDYKNWYYYHQFYDWTKENSRFCSTVNFLLGNAKKKKKNCCLLKKKYCFYLRLKHDKMLFMFVPQLKNIHKTEKSDLAFYVCKTFAKVLIKRRKIQSKNVYPKHFYFILYFVIRP
jgi:hypothetical protein